MTHMIAFQTMGEPSEALLGEGIAVCLDHSGNDYDATAADLLRSGDLIPLARMLGDAWGDYEYAYPVSGSFVCYLLNKYGADRFIRLWSYQDLEAGLRAVYRSDLATLEAQWRAMLGGH